MGQPVLSIQNISKSYGVVKALENVSFSVSKGEVHTLLGENGAGKSTLIKILSGETSPDSGVIEIGDKKYAALNPNLSRHLGISVVHQELTIFGNMTVYENIFPRQLPGNQKEKLIRKKEIIVRVNDNMKKFGLDINPLEKMNDLRLANQQMVEIIRALSENAQIVLLDEPTSGLNTQETDLLMNILKQLRDHGYTIIYISHRISEIMQISDRITILRDGRHIETISNNENLTETELISLMVGRDFSSGIYSVKSTKLPEDTPILLDVNCFSKKNVIEDISFSVRKGEVFGVFGLEGSGTHELSRMLFGLHGIATGEILLEGKKIKNITPINMISHKIIYLNNNRKDAGIFFDMSIADNFATPRIDDLSPHGFLNYQNITEHAIQYIRQFSIVLGSIYDKPSSLSGGNQQKALLSMCLGVKPRLIIVNEPTRGIDVGAKSEILKFLADLALQDMTILCFSSDLPELITLSDRILVMNSGKISGILEQGDISEKNVMRLATVGLMQRGIMNE